MPLVPSTQEAETGGLPQVQGKPELQKETSSPINQSIKKKKKPEVNNYKHRLQSKDRKESGADHSIAE